MSSSTKGSSCSSDSSTTFEGPAPPVPPLDFTLLYQKKAVPTHTECYTPVPSKSEYARHPPTPGTADITKDLIETEMKKFQYAGKGKLTDALEGLRGRLDGNKKAWVENNIVIYRLDRKYEEVFVKNRVGRTDKHQVCKQIGQHNWYINGYEEWMDQLKDEHSGIKTESRRLKQSAVEMNDEIRGLKAEIKELKERKSVDIEHLNGDTKRVNGESKVIMAENKKMEAHLVRLEKRLKRYTSKSSESDKQLSTRKMDEAWTLKPSTDKPVRTKAKGKKSTQDKTPSCNNSENHLGKYLGISDDEGNRACVNKKRSSKKKPKDEIQRAPGNASLQTLPNKTDVDAHAQEMSPAISNHRSSGCRNKRHALPPISRRMKEKDDNTLRPEKLGDIGHTCSSTRNTNVGDNQAKFKRPVKLPSLV